MTNIVFVIERICCFKQLKYNYLKNKKTFSQFFAPFLKSGSDFKDFKQKKITLIAYVFPKLQTGRKVVRQMSKKPCFRTRFESQHVKGSQTLVKLASQHVYHFFLSL